MSQQNHVGADLVSHVPQGVVPGGPGCSLGAALGTYFYCPDVNWIEPQGSALLGSGRGDIRGARLEPMVHNHSASTQAQLRGLEGGCCSERQ
jgi:hypothetical protein